MNYVGIDLGSTAAKVVVRGDHELQLLMPAGWNSRATAQNIKEKLEEKGVRFFSKETVTVATGYGRMAVDFADKAVTEITCHGKGGFALAKEDCTIIDVGGQDMKIIQVSAGKVTDFLMNDKCSAGTGKFIEIMANRLGITIEELLQEAEAGKALPISSMCTVFAESEIISYMGQDRSRNDIAAGVINSVALKVSQLYSRKSSESSIVLTGGLSCSKSFAGKLAEKIGKPVRETEQGRYAGALGAALLAEERSSVL